MPRKERRDDPSLISFEDGAMAHIPATDWPGVGEASHAVVCPVFDDALEWSAKIAVACRCAQKVDELMDDPEA